jgi:hypothetical protein
MLRTSRFGAAAAGAAALTMLAGGLGPAGAVNTGGSASSSALAVQTSAVNVLAGAVVVAPVSGTLAASSAPGASYGTDDGSVAVVAVGSVARTDAVSSASSRLPVGTNSNARVDGADIDLLGLDVLTADVVSSSATCPTNGLPGAPDATAEVAGLRVLGNVANLSAGAVTATAALGVDLGPLASGNLTVTASQPIAESATAASATAVRVTARLRVVAAGATVVDADVLQVDIANSACARPTAVAPGGLSAAPNQGPTTGGTRVVISGDDFIPGGTTVTFGGTPATVLSVADDGTEAIVSTPPHAAGPVDVAVTTPGGTGTIDDGFTYVAPGGPDDPDDPDGPGDPGDPGEDGDPGDDGVGGTGGSGGSGGSNGSNGSDGSGGSTRSRTSSAGASGAGSGGLAFTGWMGGALVGLGLLAVAVGAAVLLLRRAATGGTDDQLHGGVAPPAL